MSSIDVKDAVVELPIVTSGNFSFKRKLLEVGTGGLLARDQHNHMVCRALNGVNLSLKEGDRLGIIGHNGAGKSTLLRTLAGIYVPNTGTVEVKGSIAPIFSASIGMDMDYTGRDNIYSQAMFYGMRRREVLEKIDDIIRFADLGEFIDLPIRCYSRGMQLRLGFAIATSIDPEILLMDEDIGAGDARFVRAAEERLGRLFERSNILVMSTHSANLLERFCTKVAIMHKGTIVNMGEVKEMLAEYRKMTAPQAKAA